MSLAEDPNPDFPIGDGGGGGGGGGGNPGGGGSGAGGSGTSFPLTYAPFDMPVAWDQTIQDLQVFFADMTQTVDNYHQSDQNSYYDDGSDWAPLDGMFMEMFGWIPAVQALPGAHYWDFLTQDIDSEFMLAAYGPSMFDAAYSGGGGSVVWQGEDQISMTINGVNVVGHWHQADGTPNDPMEIVVNGGFWTFDCVGYTSSYLDGQQTPPAGGGGQATNYPADFDFAQDAQIDALAADVANEIRTHANSDRIEYSAFIWKDANGGLHRTQLLTGDASHGWIGPLDFAALGIPSAASVVSVIHSHPTTMLQGIAGGQEVWGATNSSHPSATDFDQWHDTYLDAWHVNATEFRAYLVYGNAVTEYHSFDQDWSNLHQGFIATWAVPSQDYHP